MTAVTRAPCKLGPGRVVAAEVRQMLRPTDRATLAALLLVWLAALLAGCGGGASMRAPAKEAPPSIFAARPAFGGVAPGTVAGEDVRVAAAAPAPEALEELGRAPRHERAAEREAGSARVERVAEVSEVDIRCGFEGRRALGDPCGERGLVAGAQGQYLHAPGRAPNACSMSDSRRSEPGWKRANGTRAWSSTRSASCSAVSGVGRWRARTTLRWRRR
jgi:hypothetical protein